ncbi:MAG: N-acetyltransferase family protein [Halobaculum sp.]
MKSEPTIRRYESCDRDGVWTVHDTALRAAMAEYDPEYNRYLRHVERAFLDGGEFLVGERSGEIVVIGGFQPCDSPAAYPDGVFRSLDTTAEATAHVRSVAVEPSVQSSGLGTELLTELHERARDRGFETVILSTTPSLSAAHRFYRGHEYEELATETDESGSVTHHWFGRRL